MLATPIILFSTKHYSVSSVANCALDGAARCALNQRFSGRGVRRFTARRRSVKNLAVYAGLDSDAEGFEVLAGDVRPQTFGDAAAESF